MVSTLPLTSKSSSPFINPLVTVSRAPITIGINVTFMFHSFFPFPSKVEVFILLFTFFQFYSMVSRDNKVHNFANSLLSIHLFIYLFYLILLIFLLLLLIIIKSSRLAEIKWSFVCQNPIGFWVCHSPWPMLVCAYTICSNGQISISCTISSESLCSPSHAYSHTLSVLICCILLCDW